MADRWTWTPEEWARIERRAREFRTIRSKLPSVRHDITRKAGRAMLRGAAIELRQWASEAVKRPA